jgi:hypothetical protein
VKHTEQTTLQRQVFGQEVNRKRVNHMDDVSKYVSCRGFTSSGNLCRPPLFVLRPFSPSNRRPGLGLVVAGLIASDLYVAALHLLAVTLKDVS